MGNRFVNFVVKKLLLKKRIFLKISRTSKVIDKCRLPKNTPANMFYWYFRRFSVSVNESTRRNLQTTVGNYDNRTK